MFSFKLLGRSSKARIGTVITSHGAFQTPAFMPVATQGTIKGVDIAQIQNLGAQIILVNTYHLMLRPGSKIVSDLGGIQKFTGWKGPILSDSGGFQVFSLESLRKITDEGVVFQSHIDGARELLTPERSVLIQEELGVDIAMAFDECPPSVGDEPAIEAAVNRTIMWAKRCIAARKNNDKTALFGITQGGIIPALRKRCIEELSNLPFEGFAIGGLAVGEEPAQMYEVLKFHTEQLPAEKPRYLMGVGTTLDIIRAVCEGIDMFDCVMPTRAGRFGRAFISSEDRPYINIKNAVHRSSTLPLEAGCDCFTCLNHSRGYLHHLFKADEMLGPTLISIHNLRHYQRFMADIRAQIANHTLGELKDKIELLWRDVETIKDT